MKCKWPRAFNKDKPDLLSPCGDCLPCTINRRRVIKHRILLENQLWPSSVFLTLTYSDDKLPKDYSVSPEDVKQFMYRLRKAYRKKTRQNLKFYLVGEYGEKTQRPHYHLALFNYPQCINPNKNYFKKQKFQECKCEHCSLISKAWGNGHIFSGTITADSATYVAQYVTKKMTKASDPRLMGRHPEFSRQSNRPALGAVFIDKMAEQLTRYGKTSKDDLPRLLSHGGKRLPLGRYLSERLEKMVGLEYAPNEKAISHQARMSLLLPYKKNFKEFVATSPKTESLHIAVKMLNSQTVLNLETKSRVFRKDKLI